MHAIKPTRIVGRSTRIVSLTARTLVAAILVIDLCPVAVSGEYSVDPPRRPPQSFKEIVGANFHKWDRNWDGRLSAGETDRLVTDPNVKGATAAAVAAIHFYLAGQKSPGVLPENDLMVDSHQEAARRDVNDHSPHFATDYDRFYNHIVYAPRRIFAEADAPVLQGISQGRLGDCYFVSVVGA